MATTEEILSWSPAYLKKHIAELEHKCDKLRSQRDYNEEVIDQRNVMCSRAERERDQARAQSKALAESLGEYMEKLTTAREEAYEQAAELVESMLGMLPTIKEAARRIRALKENHNG